MPGGYGDVRDLMVGRTVVPLEPGIGGAIHVLASPYLGGRAYHNGELTAAIRGYEAMLATTRQLGIAVPHPSEEASVMAVLARSPYGTTYSARYGSEFPARFRELPIDGQRLAFPTFLEDRLTRAAPRMVADRLRGTTDAETCRRQNSAWLAEIRDTAVRYFDGQGSALATHPVEQDLSGSLEEPWRHDFVRALVGAENLNRAQGPDHRVSTVALPMPALPDHMTAAERAAAERSETKRGKPNEVAIGL